MSRELVVGAIAAGVAATILAIATLLSSYLVLRRQLQVLAMLVRLRGELRQHRELTGESLAHLKEQDQTITHHVNEGMRRLERELRLHTGSNLLHSGGPPDVP